MGPIAMPEEYVFEAPMNMEATEELTRIEPGLHDATCVKVHEPGTYVDIVQDFIRSYIRVDFVIEDGDHAGEIVPRFFNLEDVHKGVKPRSDLMKFWRIATGRQNLEPGENFSTAPFKGTKVRVRVKDVTRKEDGYVYSRVEKALKR
jgi:hypothetical protein